MNAARYARQRNSKNLVKTTKNTMQLSKTIKLLKVMTVMMMLPLQGAVVIVIYLKKQIIRLHESLFPVSWMSPLLFPQSCMSSCSHPFLILWRDASGPCCTGKVFANKPAAFCAAAQLFFHLDLDFCCWWFQMKGSTLKHGISLHTLIRKSAAVSGPCLLVCHCYVLTNSIWQGFIILVVFQLV